MNIFGVSSYRSAYGPEILQDRTSKYSSTKTPVFERKSHAKAAAAISATAILAAAAVGVCKGKIKIPNALKNIDLKQVFSNAKDSVVKFFKNIKK